MTNELLNLWNRFAPNDFKSSILWSHYHNPLDFAQVWFFSSFRSAYAARELLKKFFNLPFAAIYQVNPESKDGCVITFSKEDSDIISRKIACAETTRNLERLFYFFFNTNGQGEEIITQYIAYINAQHFIAEASSKFNELFELTEQIRQEKDDDNISKINDSILRQRYKDAKEGLLRYVTLPKNVAIIPISDFPDVMTMLRALQLRASKQNLDLSQIFALLQNRIDQYVMTPKKRTSAIETIL